MTNDSEKDPKNIIRLDLNDMDTFNEVLDELGMYEDETPDAFLISGTYDEMVTEARFILSDFQDTAVKPTLAIFKYQDGYQYDIVGEDYKNLSLFNNKIAGDKITTVLKWKGDEIVELRINDI